MNRRILLQRRPVGAPTPDCFRFEDSPVPKPADGEVLLQNRYLSLDPYMRGRMSDAPSYAEPVAIGDVMGAGTISRVLQSHNPSFAPGDMVVAYGGWQTYALSNGKGLTKLPPDIPHPSLALGVLGMTGFTGYAGLLEIGKPIPGETVVVAGASGAVGSVVGQVARLKGARAVGIAGGAEKCRVVLEDFGFDACVDHHLPDFAARLKDACRDGIDVYFENVGGKVFDAVLPLLNTLARIPLCGLIANYNDTALPPGPDRLGLLMRTLLTKRISVRGFIVSSDFNDGFDAFSAQMAAWVKDGQVKYREDIVEGLDAAPQAFICLLQGKNLGKLIVHIGN